jgi:Mlc titration factor MtfA (ptsG expression regulator)
MRNGAANGMPPLHREMRVQDWTRIMTAAYDDLSRRLDLEQPCDFDPYAVTDPGEFFAVMSEYFFAQPRVLQWGYPDVYAPFRQFYRQDPAERRMLRAPMPIRSDR